MEEDARSLALLVNAISRVPNQDAAVAMLEQLLIRLATVSPDSAQLLAHVVIATSSEGFTDVASKFSEIYGEFSPASPGPLVSALSAADGLREVDLLVVAVKPNELAACLASFGIARGVLPTVLADSGLCLWLTTVAGVRVAIGMIGTAGNVEAAVLVGALARFVQPRLAVLIGMAAGVRNEVSIGDVVFAETVMEYEFSRMTVDGALHMPVPYKCRENIVRNVRLIDFVEPDLRDRCAACLDQAAELGFTNLAPPPDEVLRWEPRVKRGVVLAGGKLLEDGSLPEMRAELHDRVLAAEMEGAGFAAACEEVKWPWLVVRGVADFGETERVKNWQFASTVAAAESVRALLRHGLLLSQTFG